MIQCAASTIVKLDTSLKVENNERMKLQEEEPRTEGKDEFTPRRNGEWYLMQKDSSKSKDDASEVE